MSQTLLLALGGGGGQELLCCSLFSPDVCFWLLLSPAHWLCSLPRLQVGAGRCSCSVCKCLPASQGPAPAGLGEVLTSGTAEHDSEGERAGEEEERLFKEL